MNIYTNSNSAFPSQVVSDAEKASIEYGLWLLSMNGSSQVELTVMLI
jgi:hypothetical protein